MITAIALPVPMAAGWPPMIRSSSGGILSRSNSCSGICPRSGGILPVV
jgi:hypothetical protein